MDTAYRAVGKALESGAERKSAASVEFDAAGDCQSPKGFELHGRPAGKLVVQPASFVGRSRFLQERNITVSTGDPRDVTPIPLFLSGNVRCRKCKSCRKYRARLWARRAHQEFNASQRTWFVTLTLRPDRAFQYFELAREHVFVGGSDLDTLNSDQQFAEWCRAIGKELTLMLKRLRKNTRSDIRYIFVYERHKSGTPHIHGLVHESPGSNPVVKRAIEGAWHDGFSSAKLVDKRAVGYVTKYLSKDATTRIRASVHYGERNAKDASHLSPVHVRKTKANTLKEPVSVE